MVRLVDFTCLYLLRSTDTFLFIMTELLHKRTCILSLLTLPYFPAEAYFAGLFNLNIRIQNESLLCTLIFPHGFSHLVSYGSCLWGAWR